MGSVDGIGNVNVAVSPAGGHAGHGNGLGAAPSFAGILASTLANSSAPSGAAASPRHIPLDGHRGSHGFQETVLGLRTYRQQLIAANIANADTPGYKSVDVDFREALRIARAAGAGSIGLTGTHGSHFAGAAPDAARSIPLKYAVPQQPSADGNTVDLNVERAKFAENAVMYEFSLDRVKGHFSMMLELFRNLTK